MLDFVSRDKCLVSNDKLRSMDTKSGPGCILIYVMESSQCGKETCHVYMWCGCAVNVFIVEMLQSNSVVRENKNVYTCG